MFFYILLIPFLLQAVLILFDEWVFHIKRGLPKWERIGHPIDTISLIACFIYVFLLPYTLKALIGYIALSIFSCLLITKDEFIHKHHCPATEQWVHAVMFINHPILLSSLGFFWYGMTVKESTGAFYHVDNPLARSFMISQLIFVSLFCLYQIIYWNVIWKEKKQQ